MSALKDLSGERYGRLIVITRADSRRMPNGKPRSYWRCKCDCGNFTEVQTSALKSGDTRSCGCYRKETYKTQSVTHGGSHEKLYNVWRAMKRRCTDSRDKRFMDYGGRGISMCDDWSSDYSAFRTWALANGYREGLSIDRIDNDGSYCPYNCRWETVTVQQNNRRNTTKISFNGETMDLSSWANKTGISKNTLRSRLRLGWPIKRVFAAEAE